MVKPKDKEVKKEEVVEEVEDQSAPNPSESTLNAYAIRDALEFGKPFTPIEDRNGYYRWSPDGLFLAAPVRDECVKSQLIPSYHYIAWGWDWAIDGTVTTPVDPMTGIAYSASTYAALSYDPSVPWTGTSWEKYHGGRLYYALLNYIRSNQMFSEADLIKIVKAIIGYEKIGWAIMQCYIHWKANLWPLLDTYVRSEVLASSEGSALFGSISDLISGINLQTSVNFFPWPVLDFWIPRGLFALSKQNPWQKYLMFLPNIQSTMTRYGIASLTDSYTTTQNWKHPQTYLQEQDLWDDFRDKLVPLLWGKKSFESYTGIGLLKYLEDRQYKAVIHDTDWFYWLTQKFFVHPFTETGGIGCGKLPKRAAQAEDAVKTMNDYYWEGSGDGSQGNVFYLPDTSFVGPKAVYSPWLDIMRFHGILDNYAANNDNSSTDWAQTLRLITGSTFTELDYNTLWSFFPKYALEFQKLELVEPEADITLHAAGQNFSEMTMQNKKFLFPFKMPERHWYTQKTQFKWLYASYLGLDLRDVELFKVQRPSGWNNEGTITSPTLQ
jgi:hypothetical protein